VSSAPPDPLDEGGETPASGDHGAGDLKQASSRDLLQAAQQDGYSRIEEWKVQELQLTSRDQILIDRDGNLYSGPRRGPGTPSAFERAGATMNRVSATLSIWSQDLRPEKISQILSFQADRSVLKGTERTPPRPRPTAFGWHVNCSKKNVDMPDDVIGLLLDRVSGITNKVAKLKDLDPGIRVIFHVSIAPKTANLPLLIDKEKIEAIAEFGGDLDIEFFDL
jgi:hypothetical protein